VTATAQPEARYSRTSLALYVFGTVVGFASVPVGAFNQIVIALFAFSIGCSLLAAVGLRAVKTPGRRRLLLQLFHDMKASDVIVGAFVGRCYCLAALSTSNVKAGVLLLIAAVWINLTFPRRWRDFVAAFQPSISRPPLSRASGLLAFILPRRVYERNVEPLLADAQAEIFESLQQGQQRRAWWLHAMYMASLLYMLTLVGARGVLRTLFPFDRLNGR
jgi:hypothetical protein